MRRWGACTGRRVITPGDVEKGRAVESDDVKTALLKYIPAEVVTAYVALDAGLKALSAPAWPLGWLTFLALWILTPVYIYFITKDGEAHGSPPQIVIATVSFFLWVFTLGGPFATFAWYSPGYSGVILAFWTLLPPMLLHAERPKRQTPAPAPPASGQQQAPPRT